MFDVSIIKEEACGTDRAAEEEGLSDHPEGNYAARRGFSDGGARPVLETWWASLAPGCAADGAWHDITASKEVARHSPQRKGFFSDTDDDGRVMRRRS